MRLKLCEHMKHTDNLRERERENNVVDFDFNAFDIVSLFACVRVLFHRLLRFFFFILFRELFNLISSTMLIRLHIVIRYKYCCHLIFFPFFIDNRIFTRTSCIYRNFLFSSLSNKQRVCFAPNKHTHYTVYITQTHFHFSYISFDTVLISILYFIVRQYHYYRIWFCITL